MTECENLIEKAKAVICFLPFHALRDCEETRTFLMSLEDLRQAIVDCEVKTDGAKKPI